MARHEGQENFCGYIPARCVWSCVHASEVSARQERVEGSCDNRRTNGRHALADGTDSRFRSSDSVSAGAKEEKPRPLPGFFCSLLRRFSSRRFLSWNFRALLSCFGKSDGDSLLAAFYFAALSALSGFECSLFATSHRGLDALACSCAVFPPAG